MVYPLSLATFKAPKKRHNRAGSLRKGNKPLNSFLPFDSYLLYRSYTHAEPYYRKWESNFAKSDIFTMDVDMDLEDKNGKDFSYDEGIIFYIDFLKRLDG